MSDHFFKTRKEIKAWLDSMSVKRYTIHDDLTVDVTGSVGIAGKNLTWIPVKFGVVDGRFDCSLNKLTHLFGSPVKCGDFDCEDNNLVSLDGAPNMVSGWFDCHNNQLINLVGSPRECKDFYCQDNRLTSIKGAPSKCQTFHCAGNQLISLIGAPNECDYFDCSDNRLTSLDGVSGSHKKVCCYENPDLFDISAVADGCEIEYDHDAVAKNRAARQLAMLGASGGVDGLDLRSKKLGRIL